MKEILLVFALGLSFFGAYADEPSACTYQLTINSVIGPGTLDYIERGMKKAEGAKCESLLLLINTPGGNLQTTRIIVEKILNSPIPFLCLVSPPGGHAGSAGAIILQACHVSGAMEATNIGAASPVALGGEKMDEDMRKKLFNDTSSWVEGLASLRGRNKQFAREIVTEAKSVDAKEAHRIGGIDQVVNRLEDFLKFSDNRKVKMSETKESVVKTGVISDYPPDLRVKFLDFVTHPQIAYMLFMISIGLLYFEFTHPGIGVPGVIGGVGLILSLLSFHMLDVRWGGLALLGLGILFMIGEAFLPSFGVLGIGGIAAFVFGSLLLFDPATGNVLPLGLILPTAIGVGLMMLGLGYLVFQTRKVKKRSGGEGLMNTVGKVVSLHPNSNTQGMIEVQGEIWKFVAREEVKLDQMVIVKGIEGFTLLVERKI